MSRRWLLSVAVLAIVAAAIVSWRLWPRDPGSDAPPAAQVGALVYVEPNVGLTLRAVPTHAGYLSSDGAWAKWGWAGDHVAPGVTAQFGLLSDEGRHRLVWAYSEPGCAALPGNTRRFSPAHPPKCRAWVFLSPKTGRMVLGIGGKIG